MSKIDKKANNSKEKSAVVKKKVKNLSNITVAKFNVFATKNNTIVSVTDGMGNVLVGQISSGMFFRGAKKSTPFASKQIVTKILEQIYSFGLKTIDLNLKGIGSGRDAAVEAIKIFASNNHQLIVNSVADKTPFPHNGCRARKRRRV